MLFARPEDRTNRRIAALVRREASGTLSSRTRLAHRIRVDADPALGIEGEWRSPRGRLLELDVRTSGPGGWCALHMRFSGGLLKEAGFLGLMCSGVAPEITRARACLRSGTREGFVDRFFDKHLLLRPEIGSHMDAVALGDRSDAPADPPWREVILFFPTRPFRATLLDFRVFTA
ncbi:hypothetical protein [Histidinibacterium aquaticum]|uniref:Uncharacterized protein n=1 Tax=Histidinibacterium aquaticum TaxID=2613962 RepID=A0A5J5GAY2_9RHOB|nr:hypothetical protein [Histidinibacterium aquaticum]KAA9005090.1 hypothetical protein F3S47_18860 [Histidinibacterium aquaticum]